ncbi:hypothetical protein AAF712_016130 [Marasmius tenuissimus]|uniref:Uncharacterized protein n=1 Tax=Marasmius tenuissimus TaxID=585030 RepID=A0ABR2Z9V2_9AGAR
MVCYVTGRSKFLPPFNGTPSQLHLAYILARRHSVPEPIIIVAAGGGVYDDNLLSYRYHEGRYYGDETGHIMRRGISLVFQFRDPAQFSAFRTSISTSHEFNLAETAQIEQYVKSSLWRHLKAIFTDACQG